jgi:hypothetical protein
MVKLLIINVTYHMPWNRISGTITNVSTSFHKRCSASCFGETCSPKMIFTTMILG